MRPRVRGSFVFGPLIFAAVFLFMLSAFADLPPMDVDAMAARFAKNQDIYKKTRDDALAVYAAASPVPPLYDNQVKTVIRLFAYLAVWGDFYGEDLWQRGSALADAADRLGARDVVLDTFQDCDSSRNSFSSTEEGAENRDRRADIFANSRYPSLLKTMVLAAALDNLNNYAMNYHPDATQPSMVALRGKVIFAWGSAYRDLIRMKLPHQLLFVVGDGLLHAVGNDEKAQDVAIAEIERDFNEADPANVVRTILDGDFEVTDAWCARGSDYADTVNDAAWKVFGDRLAKADAILEPLYAKAPNEASLCHVMMNVELGQGQERDRMETWFKRGVAIDPDWFNIYKDKEWYLQPRWYGSAEDVFEFGQECANGQNWASKVPLILCIGIAEASNGNGDIYQDPNVWGLVEKTYRDYLNRYPQAIFYRTSFAKHAYDSGHFDVAKEQLTILGNDWDRDVIPDSDHQAMMAPH